MNEDLVKLFKALGEESRLRIVQCVLAREHCACEFTAETGKDQTTISRHLKVLVEAGLLSSEKKGRYVIYKVADERMRERLEKFGIHAKDCCCGGYCNE